MKVLSVIYLLDLYINISLRLYISPENKLTFSRQIPFYSFLPEARTGLMYIIWDTRHVTGKVVLTFLYGFKDDFQS